MFTGFVAYLCCFAMFIPALLSAILGTTFLSFWYWWESRFIGIAFFSFVPFFVTADSLKDRFWRKLAFNVTGVWMILWAIPDMYANFMPVIGQLPEAEGYLFGSLSIFFAVCNICLYAILVLRMRARPKQAIIIKQLIPAGTIVERKNH